MSRLYRYSLLAVLILATLACGLISNPISSAQNLASTAEAMATAMPVQTLEALPSAMPDVTGYLNPTGKPVSDWNNIPIMSQATAGQEFSKTTYSFKASGITDADVQTFYSDKLKALGWSSSFSAQGGSSGGIMFFTKDKNTLSITTVSTDNNSIVVVLVLQ